MTWKGLVRVRAPGSRTDEDPTDWPINYFAVQDDVGIEAYCPSSTVAYWIVAKARASQGLCVECGTRKPMGQAGVCEECI